MAQSANNESELNLSLKQRKRSMSSKMSLTKEQLMEMDTEEIFDWTVEKLDAALKELNVTGAGAWNKSKKANELSKAIEKIKAKEVEDSKISTDPNMFMMQAVQMMQKSMEAAEERQQRAMEALHLAAEERAREDREAQNYAMQKLAETIGAAPEPVANVVSSGGSSKSRARGCKPEKLDRDVDYASFLQWEKLWKLYVITEQLATLKDN